MAPQDLLFDLLSRAFVLSIPIAVGVLAFRRLLISQTTNAWVYALAVGYASFSALGLMPWSLGLQPVSATFMVLALICPLLWIAIIFVCGLGQNAPYDLDTLEEAEAMPPPELPTLLLRNPVLPEHVPVFRHYRSPERAPRNLASEVVNVARSMRGRETSEARRVRKLLPPPRPEPPDLPFLR